MESEKAKIGCPQTCGERKKRPDLCQFIDKDLIEIKKRLLEVPLSRFPSNSLASLRLSLRSVFTLLPDSTGIRDGGTTKASIPSALSRSYSPKPQGPAS